MNNLTVAIGGKQRELKFNMGTFKFIGEITEGKPLDQTADSPVKMYGLVKTVVHAALLSSYFSKQQKVDFTAAQVESWVNDLSIPEAIKIVNAFTESSSVKPDLATKKK